MKNKSFLKGTVIGVLFMLVTLSVTAALQVNYENVDDKLAKIDQVLEQYYIGDIDPVKMEEGIYRGFVDAVGDPYTAYFTPEEYDKMMEQTSGVYAGIGVQMTVDQTDNTILVVEVFENSPAQKAGMLAKDKIIGADGQSFTGDDFEHVPNVIKGEEGTRVTVEVYRPSEDKNYTFDIERANIIYPSVDYEMLDEEIGHIHIRRFEELTASQFEEALLSVVAEGAKGIILDLRDNPGGVLSSTLQIADMLLPEGVILSAQDNTGNIREYKSSEEYLDIPIVVLINEQSASASEVLSGALKDHNRATLVGTRTVGKGIIQTILPFTDGSALKVTTAEYFLPSGVSIQGIGIEPDYFIELPIELVIKSSLDYEEDIQLQKGIELLKEQIR